MLALAILAIPALPAPGQTAPVKTRMLTLSLDQQLENVFFMNAGKVVPFNADRTGLGSPFDYTGTRQFILRASAEEFTTEPPLPPPLAAVPLPEGAKLVLLVCSRSPDDKIKLAAYDVSIDGFRAGDYKVFNFSRKTVSLIFGRSKFALKPGENKIVSDPALQNKALDVAVQIAQVEGGKPKRVYASAWGHQPVKRNYVFLFDGSHPTRPIAIRRFSDRPE